MKKQIVLMAVAFAGAWMWAGVPLPNGYRAIESIDSTGRQWIDSGYVLRPDTKVECTVRIPRRQNDVSYLALFGACNKNSYDHALQAFLVIQMEVLGKLAAKLGKAEEAKSWQAKSDDLLARMFAYDYGPWSDSLIYHVTVILGHRMPADQRARYVAPLKTDRFLTEWGLASEALKSPKYEYNGYWQGPIWAPYTLLMIDGLRDMGETEFANDLARRFMRLFQKSGSAENFDPITGQGLRDLAYTWTSSVFLELMRSTPPVDR